MNEKVKIYIHRHEDLNPSIQAVEAPRPLFRQARGSIETLITIARRMPAANDDGEWGIWRYHDGFRHGVLTVPFGGGGVASVSLDSGGELGQDDIAHSQFSQAAAVWESGRYTYAALALPDSWGRQHESVNQKNRLFFFYQDAGGVLRLEQFGSAAAGWHTSIPETVTGLEISINNVSVPMTLNYGELENQMQYRKHVGGVSDIHLDRIAV